MNTTPTKADLAGTSERGRAAFQARLRRLRELGIPLPPGAVIDEPARADVYALDPEGDAIADMDAFDAELDSIEREDAEQRGLPH